MIRGVRSIADSGPAELDALTALVGKNSSGKSNFLRALNLFFNGEIEPSKPLVFVRDHHARSTTSKKKKRIEITVAFELPKYFKLRKELASLAQLGTSFSITRTWSLDQRRQVTDSLSAATKGKPIPNSAEAARQMLGLVAYRYIPNRSIPAALLRDESQAIADSIFLRMKGDQHSAGLLASLTAAAARMLKGTADSMQAAGSPLDAPRIALPESLGEMLKMSGFQANSPGGGAIQDEDWGAGHQAFFLYLVLHALDTNYGRFFGWRQATIWGVEEPESALHRDLETRLAARLREWSRNDASRLQVVVTTHSPVFVMAAEKGFWAEIRAGETHLQEMAIPPLTRAAEVRGVTGWVQPILSFPWNPVVLVEGRRDVEVLSHVATIAGSNHLRFLALPDLDPSEKQGGKDAVVGYLRRNQGLIQNRPSQAPFLVLLDWDASNQDVEKAKKAYGPGADLWVLRMNNAHCSPTMGSDFKGIERFYPPGVVAEAHQAGELVLGIAAGKPYSIAKSQLEQAKGALLNRVLRVDDPRALKPLLLVIQDIEAAARGGAGAQLSFPGFSAEGA